jgi:Fe-S cluster biogenesis protein NfuA
MAKRLYVGNLKYTVTSEQLQQIFEQFGTVSSAQVLSDRETGRSRGFGFVEMANSRELFERIEKVLDESVRPDLRAVGVDLIVVGIDADNIVQVRLAGLCEGCSSSVISLCMRVEATLKSKVPEVRFLEAVP